MDNSVIENYIYVLLYKIYIKVIRPLDNNLKNISCLYYILEIDIDHGGQDRKPYITWNSHNIIL